MKQSTIQMKNISMEFPGVKALSGVDFHAQTGCAHALIGANGAGKSTLMKILSGAYGDYTGSVEIDGVPAEIRAPVDAKRFGIETVYQEVDTALVPGLTVAENIMLDALAGDMGRRQFVRWKALYSDAQKALAKIHVALPLREKIDGLTLAQKQLVLIARALSRDCRFLVLDEPTAPLSVTETQELFRIVNEMKAHNVGIIFISHRLPELFEICDDITVLRDGRFVVRRRTEETDQNELVNDMLGKKTTLNFARSEARGVQAGVYALEVKDLSDREKISGIHMQVKAGEIVGVTGLVGAGKTELCKAVFGASQAKGSIRINGKPVRLRSPAQAVKEGLALVPEERRREGILAQDSVGDNLTVTRVAQLCRFRWFLDFAKLRKAAEELVEKLSIHTPGLGQKIAFLSGGNQQKAVVGKWIAADASVYLFDEPTKGVDVNAKKDIFQIIENLALQGKAVVYASCEFSEILAITDRVYVMYGGRIVKELETTEATEEKLLYYSTGGQ